MKRTCEVCGLVFNDETRKETCPHADMTFVEKEQQRKQRETRTY